MNPELALFRIGATIAWADGTLEEPERQRLLQALAEARRREPGQQEQLDLTLASSSPDALPLAHLDALVAALPSQLERERALKLAYGVIRASQREGDHGSINSQEHQAYDRLVTLLELPADQVARLEGSVELDLARSAGNPVDLLAGSFAGLIGWC